ncbi:MAG: glutamate-5-semialdehyde dehydrogenase [Rhodospirillaceae bacterium]|jgi:glutamate-5-semialdehyde dehydrogenase|nr:glutamate-5-semialdehyde dehydrogenase [Rhodospirillaceae bacterium]MBT5943296.1 glutamate-5-semialdehyde dehydrogenase [Rhodospirillaceae bacterium]MBT6404808.1 glutamate-5-semialdehyde dehydrogenase [Rhodospirillaceae bacterium]MBT6536763.1 glutamate-5-semialdehyde dehydrogenase [Rhodospirillaceae bacterium]MBT7360527.1 glutamate-5-semialdehyde dehydrogenase [Rhodospirillaceae bacterium]
MTAVHDISADAADIRALMQGIGAAAKAAALELASATPESKNVALHAASTAIRARKDEILAANANDVARAEGNGVKGSFLDRLILNEDRIEGMAKGLEEVAALDDPIGTVLAEWDRPNGLRIARVRVPLGVIGVIYESRPNVTADAGGLCLKAGNAAILRGGSESFDSSNVILSCLQDGLRAAGLPEAAIQAPPTTDREAVGAMLTMVDFIDVIVPRGGKSLIERVQTESRIPVFAHLEGLCHTYVHGAADPQMARDIVLNAKMRRTGICGATETVLIDRSVASDLLGPIVDDLVDAGCEVRGDTAARDIDDRIVPANDADWDTEYLDAIVSVRVVDGVEAAIDHVNSHGSNHTDAIVTSDSDVAERFLARIDSGIVLHNASTQFADGGEFGMGAEIGISTGKMHARGPVGAEQLTSYKYVVRGAGQTRP